LQTLMVRAKYSAVKQSKFYIHTLSILFCWSLTFIFAPFFVSGVHAFKQPEENTPERLLNLGYIPGSVIALDSENNPTHAIIVDKASQQLFILAYDGTLRVERSFPCSTGMNKGNKKQSGDRKTPEGAYFFTKKFRKRELSPTYGSLAFPMDYPNFLDTLENRDGNSIWLHGTNKPLKPRDSNGCVVMNNDDIRTVSKYIKLNRTPIVIEDKIEWVPVDQVSEEKKGLLAFLNEWEHAFKQKNQSLYLACYKDQATVNAPLWQAWEQLHKKWGDDIILFDLYINDVFLFRQGNGVIALFDEVVTFPGNTLIAGTKKLYLAKNDNHWKIVGETWQLPTKKKPKDQRLVALKKLDQIRDENHAITEVIKGWIKAWSEKDLARYISYYASDFRFNGMNRTAWKRYKRLLNKLYGPITITLQELQITPKRDKRVVTFRQTYSASESDLSDGHKDVGIKKLRLKRIGKDWKIYRETWEEL